MSTRAIKKLTKKDDLKELDKLNKLALNNEDEEENEEEVNAAPLNKFNLLDELVEGADKEEDSDHESDLTNEIQTKKTNKKKNKKKAKQSKTNNDVDFKFVSSTLDDELDDDKLIEQELRNKDNSTSLGSLNRRLFQIESKHLNSDNEMIRMFGAKIVQQEKANQNKNRRGNSKLIFKTNTIVAKKPTWPEFSRHGLSMRILQEAKGPNDPVEFTFEHSKEYQSIQFAFLDAVESLDHHNIINVLHMSPYHIDSLIQLSDISRMSDDTQMAADFIERTLYALQSCFHPSFNFISKGANQTPLYYKLDYNRVENRGFFIALFKHTIYVGGKACYRTSLELCKLLLSLDVENDSLGAILLIDFYAIRSGQFEYLIEFYEAFNASKHLYMLPNMAFSVALAHFNLFNQTNDATHLEKGEKLLQDALVRFPSILMDLLEKCSVTPDKEVENHWIFSKTSHLSVPQGLKYLIDLYVTRMHYEWKIPENVQWLEKNVKHIISREKSLQSSINENKKKNRSLFANVPTNLYRHLILSDLKEVAAHLPAEYGSTATYTFDPIPPKNSIISYTRPARTAQANSGSLNRAEGLITFFQSLLPSFNAQDLGRNNEAGAAAEGNNNRFDMQNIVGRLREFLNQIEQNFPGAQLGNERDNENADNNNNDDNDDFHEID